MKTIKIILGIVITWLLYYITLPTIALDNVGFYFYLAIVIFMFSLFFNDTDEYYFTPNKTLGLTSIGMIVLIILIWGFGTNSMIWSKSYHNIINEVPTKDYKGDIQPIDPTNIIFIDDQTAQRLGDKRLSDGDNIVGSQVNIGKYTLQKIGDKLYYVAPLLHSGFFKYLNNTNGTDGYIMVNSTDDKDVKYVPDYKIEYQPDAFFSRDLKRHIRFNGYLTDFFSINYHFELNDEGEPYWVVSKYENTIGFSGHDVVSVILVNASTGDIKEYDLDEVPFWVDRVHPLHFVTDQLTWWGI